MHDIEPDNKNQKRGTKMKLTDKIYKKKNTQEIENFTDLVKARYSARSMSERKVEKEKLDQILEVARLSPTACNLQRQRLKVVTSKEGIQKLRDCTPCHFKASTIIILSIEEDTKDSAMKGDDWYKFGLIDIGIVAEHMALKATELGIGSPIVGMMDADKVREMFAIPVTEHPVLLLPLGYPDEKGKPCILHASRLPIDDTVTWA